MSDEDTKPAEQEQTEEVSKEPESKPVEEAVKSEGQEDAKAPEDKPEESPEEETAEDGKEEAEDTKPELSEDDEKSRKRHNDKMARQRIREREKTERQIASQLDQAYGPQTKDELIDQGLSEERAEIEAAKQELQYERTRGYIANLNAKLKYDAQQVMTDFPVFNPEDKENYDPEFTAKVEARFIRAARIQQDKSGIITNAEEDLYDFYADMAEMYTRGTDRGADKGQKDALKMASRSQAPSSGTPKVETKKFEEKSIKEMEKELGFVRA